MSMTPDDIAKFKGLYVQTAGNYVADLGKNIEVLKISPDNNDAIKAIHLASHSLTSQSTLMGFTQMSAAASAIEHYSKALIDSTTPFTAEAVTTIADIVAAMAQSVDEIERTGVEIDLSAHVAKLRI